MARVVAFDYGWLMLRNVSAPFLNATDVRQKSLLRTQIVSEQKTIFARGKHDFGVSKWFHDETKHGSILNE